jgi:hypothetical protein
VTEPPRPAVAGKQNTALIVGVAVGAVLLCVAAICVVGVGAFTIPRLLAGAETPEATATGPRTPATAPGSSRTPATRSPSPAVSRLGPPPAAIGDCIVVGTDGSYVGQGNCNGSRGTYRVLSVDASRGPCADPESGDWITAEGYKLCLERHLVRTFCYKFPKGRGWIVGAPRCQEPGTVMIVDIVPGGTNGDRCTRDLRWNHWYSFTHPTVAYCVMKY